MTGTDRWISTINDRHEYATFFYQHTVIDEVFICQILVGLVNFD